ncbi:hypothetical protein [Planobispora longispora]|uniref:hypothetical protein n=1 Tax=Planobispora longispora TaxID=28887 RepID=UPI003622710A|nr:hypothetical protein GCM10020093_117790 [Planobispora longispora]
MITSSAARRFRLRRTAAAAMTVLVTGALTACAAGEPAPGRSPAGPSAGAHRLVLPPPQRVEGFRLDGMWPFFTRQELLDRQPHLGDAEGVSVRDAVQVRYEEAERAEGQKWTRKMIFTGYDAELGPDRRRQVVEAAVGDFLEGVTPDHRFDLTANPSNESALCIGIIELGSETGMCAWADDGTIGVVTGANLGAAELKAVLPAFRAAVER